MKARVLYQFSRVQGLDIQRLQIWTIWLVLIFFAFQTSDLALKYILGHPSFFDPVFQEKYIRHLTLVRCHGVSASLALVAGILSFSRLSFKLKFHRHLGRVYLLAVVIASLTAFPMALEAEGGALTRFSFALLASLWLGSAALAYQTARKRRFALHRVWIIRNYSLTYGAVLTRLAQNFLLEVGYSFESLYPVTSWSWLLTLAIGQWWIAFSRKGKK